VKIHSSTSVGGGCESGEGSSKGMDCLSSFCDVGFVILALLSPDFSQLIGTSKKTSHPPDEPKNKLLLGGLDVAFTFV
jgi:hypothetical protein